MKRLRRMGLPETRCRYYPPRRPRRRRAQKNRVSVNTATLQRPWQHDAEVIGLISLAHGTSHFFHLLLPPLFPWLIRDFGLNFTQCGLLMTVFFLISGI